MIVRFALHPDIFEGQSVLDTHYRSQVLETMAQFGMLCWTDDMKSEMIRRLKGIPSRERQQWVETMRGVVRAHRARCLLAAKSAQDLIASDSEELVVLDGTTFDELLGTDEIAATILGSSTQATRFEALQGSPIVTALRTLSCSELWNGSRREDVWSERFAPLIQVSRHAVLSDPYAFRNPHGLGWTLEQMMSAPTALSAVTVFSSFEAGTYDVSEALKTFGKSLVLDLAQVEVRLVAVRSDLMPRISHDRYLRLDDARLIKVGSGFDIFSEDQLVRPCQFTYTFIRTTEERNRYRQLEDQLERNRVEELILADDRSRGDAT